MIDKLPVTGAGRVSRQKRLVSRRSVVTSIVTPEKGSAAGVAVAAAMAVAVELLPVGRQVSSSELHVS